ncbi:MAG TPA: hypothetical protein VJ654_19350 [Noviherbaspirillum sp.]|nr:hypothetical protein [Noviherbaspirillum sp.]
MTTFIDGKAVTKPDQPIETIDVVITAGTFSSGTAGSIANSQVKTLMPALAKRVPMMFSLNGIPTQLATSRTPNIQTPTDLRERHARLYITPRSATWNSRTGSALNLDVQLDHPMTRSTLWRGTIIGKTMGFGKFDEEVADRFASKILTQLNEDGIIKLNKPTIDMPAPAQPAVQAKH